MDIPILRQRQEILIKNEQYAKERCFLSLAINNNDTPKENYIMMAINNLQSILDTIKAEKQ